MNLILHTDSYKVTQYPQYPPKTTNVYSYFESRGGKYDYTVFFGLQYLLKKYLSTRISSLDLIEASDLFRLHFGRELINKSGWNHIIHDHKGYLPLSIKAVPEGSVIPNKNVLVTVENTCPLCYWLTNYVETLLVQLWYPTTVATLSREVKKVINRYLERSGDVGGCDFKLHDFGFRGVSSVESAAVGGGAHLINFKGTDTIVALTLLRDYYGERCAGLSIPASEHSTITSWGKEGEVDAFRNMLEAFPDGLIACVSDSFDIYRACRDLWGSELKDKVINRNGCLVIRPDSGYPPHIVRDISKILWQAFGGKTNSKGYKVLDDHVRIIQGDGITPDNIDEILHQLTYNGFSADNVAFGMGGGLLQKLDRDTNKFAFKCSSVVVDGKERDVYKQPITDPLKVSKSGRLKLIKTENVVMTVNEKLMVKNPDLLQEVYRDGRLLIDQNFSEIRSRASL